MSPHISIPREIIDLFIAELFESEGKKALFNVALSSRSFLHAARLHLFGSLNLQLRACPTKNVQDWEIFQSILLQSPSIKHCVHDLSIGSFAFWNPTHQEILQGVYRCGAHRSEDTFYHALTPWMLQDFDKRKISCMLNILPSLRALQAIRVNYGRENVQDSWRSLPASAARSGILSLLSSQVPITTLTLSFINDVPISVISSILRLSQLTTLMFEEVCVENDVPADSFPRKSYLNLHTFGLISWSDTAILRVAHLIIQASSQSLRALTWFNMSEKRGEDKEYDLPTLPNLKIYSTNLDGYSSRIIRPALLHFVDARRPTIEVLEFLNMNCYTFKDEVKEERGNCEEIDQLLEDTAFSNLLEFRFLFNIININPCPSLFNYYECFPLEKAGAMFKSFMPRTAARGVVFSYGDRFNPSRVLHVP